jgi:hypothetical protein
MQFRLLIIAVNASATELTARECVPSDIWEQSAYLTCGNVYQKEEEEKEGKKHDHDKQDKENMRYVFIYIYIYIYEQVTVTLSFYIFWSWCPSFLVG